VWAKQGKEREFPAMTNEAWLMGYLSGRASALNKDFLKGTDNESIYVWIDNYCRDNPTKDVDDAAKELVKELIQQKGL
jgi:hypothetical protein